jgi:hypothetical protein
MGILKGGSESSDILEGGFRVVASASAGNEVVKECFMVLKVDELIFQVMGEKSNSNVQSLYDAIRVLLTPDDNRVVASQVCPICLCNCVNIWSSFALASGPICTLL